MFDQSVYYVSFKKDIYYVFQSMGGTVFSSLRQIHHGPIHNNMISVSAREYSFHQAPPIIWKKRERMAEAGLFYIGVSDQVKCFYCDGGLEKWQEKDDPWVVHAGRYNECQFIKLVMTDEIIKICQEIVELVRSISITISITNFFKKRKKKEEEY